MRPSSDLLWLVGAALGLAVATAGPARADLVDQATSACKARSTVEQMGRLLASNDMRSYRRLVASRTKVGDCKPLKARTDVKVDKREGELACVKVRGDARCWWVLETNLRITSERREPVRQDYFACKSQLYLETGRKIMTEDDPDAIRRFQIATSQSGQCLTLQKGERVDIERRDGKLLCVRPPGEEQCYWTDSLVLPASVSEKTGAGDESASERRNPRRRK